MTIFVNGPECSTQFGQVTVEQRFVRQGGIGIKAALVGGWEEWNDSTIYGLMRARFLSLILLSSLFLIPGCGKDDAKSSPNNPNSPAAGTPNNGGAGGANNNCYCDECGCYILYSDGSYMDVDSCGAQPQQNYPQQQYPQQQYPQQNYYPQNYGNNQQGFFPRLRNWFNTPQQQGYGYPQQNYGYPQQQGYGYPQQQGYGYPQQQGYGYPQQQGYGYPQQQGYGYPQQGNYPRY